jgi:hypothetical protein
MWAVARLSQNTTLPGCHRKRTVKAGMVIRSKNRASRCWLSTSERSTIRLVNIGLTYNARSPVSGWTRTTGCTAECGRARTTSPYPSLGSGAAALARNRCSARSRSARSRNGSDIDS